ncbi:MAG: efflux RND transporter periplasmic adaptor subunit [Pseudomonadales bacterium]|nr:efflux RND transporter periplasmic adaptor subunit [Pseudomonadales bacterium]
MKIKRFSKPLLLLAFFALGVLWLLDRSQPGLAVSLGEVIPRHLVVTVREQGRTRAREPYTIAAPVNGQLLRTDLREGIQVEKNQVLSHIAIAPENQRTAATLRANLEAAQARLNAAQSTLQEAEGQLQRSQREAARRQSLFDEGMIGAEENELYRQAYVSAQSRLLAARATLRASEAEVSSANSQLIGITADNDTPTIPVLAPVSGTLLRVYEKSERVVVAGTPLFELSDGNALELVIDLLTQEAVLVSPGDSIQIEGWGGNTVLPGRVLYVEPEAFTKFSALGVEEQRVNVIGELLTSDIPLGAGYRFEAAIITWEQEDILTIPAAALFRREGNWHVFVVEENTARLRQVGIGQRNQEYAQVLDGLSTGDRVILFPSDQVEHGIPVSF